MDREELLERLREMIRIVGPRGPTQRMMIGDLDIQDPEVLLDTLHLIMKEMEFERFCDGRLLLKLHEKRMDLAEANHHLILENQRLHRLLEE